MHDDNAELFGQQPNGRIDKSKVAGDIRQGGKLPNIGEWGFQILTQIQSKAR